MASEDQQKLREEQRRIRLLRYDLKNRFGLSLEQYEYQSEKQGGVCALCKKQPEKNLFVDVDSRSKKARGLLCNRCKMGIAYFNNDPELIANTSKYIKDFDEMVQ